MSDHRFVRDRPALEHPVLVTMLTGWIDASGAAAAAMEVLAAECDAVALVEFDDDQYIDYRARRPVLELRDGVSTRLVWSSPTMQVGRTGAGRDLLLLSGPEPDMAWHRFAGTVGELAAQFGVQRSVSLGAYPFATPHTRPVTLSATSPSRDLITALPFRANSVDVPAGMTAVLEQVLHDRGIPAVGVWAQVPHYIASMSYPASSLALLDGLETVTGVATTAADLRREAVVQRERLDHLVRSNDEHAAMVAELERIYDATEEARAVNEAGELELRSGDELAAEVERFLRDQD